MRAGETLALGYFLVVGGAALALMRCRPGWRRALAWAAAGVLVATTARCAPAIALADAADIDLRDWWLLLALPLAYWAPAPLAGAANVTLERWLQAIDDTLGLTRLDPRGHGVLEFAYLLVYPMVPAALLAVITGAHPMADRFWSALLAAVLPCYGLLPLLPTRPPRAFLMPQGEPLRHTTTTTARRANVRFLATFGNGWNTLPSGHAAGAAAVAVVVWRSGSPLAPVFTLLAMGIALGTVRGRYHYAVDTILGVALGVAAGALAP